ncbi:GntR family transcriptional regulator [Arthrobacter russicus]|jgi:GntR family transcriptional regulator|uniref:GntR family transcriptional regulator n=1 Tax=Arthrobacter russicus TaxID=172040 RepID=A0ABU1JDC5_9MICC|nr:GntR family transcriptional regulator [Arthrobacter russicus]MBQ1445597.1 GntR family transcriptional regulator [Renibacterium sp.]MDN5668971.1 GntR family transcriptional regulator [Renibacterium salmoninarum]MDR6270431.1 GntR family transcriptional regulator [Arthrobacter russicus]
MTTPLHLKLSEEFRKRIHSGVWPQGSLVPSEAQLCAEFSVSRGPVRQALAALRQDGSITGGRGRSPMVRGDVPSQSFGTFMSFTQWAESINRVPGQKTLEIARRPAGEYVAEQLGIDAEDSVVAVFRLRFLDGSPTMLERSHYVTEAGNPLFNFDTDSGSTFRYLRENGVELSSARHIIDAVAATDEDAHYLGIEPGAPLLRERRISFSDDGSRLEYGEDRYRPELTSFMIDNTLANRTPLARIDNPEQRAARHPESTGSESSGEE